MRKQMKPGHQYFLINIDEPYAQEIYEVLKRGQMKKGEWPEGDISFDEWKRQTFGHVQKPGVHGSFLPSPGQCIGLSTCGGRCESCPAEKEESHEQVQD